MASTAKPKAAPPADRSAVHAAICKRLREIRVAAGESQKEIAEAIGADLDQYRKWEKRAPPPVYYTIKLVEYFDMDPWWFLTGRFGRRPTENTPGRTPDRPFAARA